jgi:hypothetical protein
MSNNNEGHPPPGVERSGLLQTDTTRSTIVESVHADQRIGDTDRSPILHGISLEDQRDSLNGTDHAEPDAAADLGAALTRLTANRAVIASCLEEHRTILAASDSEAARAARHRKRTAGGYMNGKRAAKLAEALDALQLAGEALSAAHVAMSDAQRHLEAKRERILELEEQVAASGEFAAELVRLRQRIEEAKAKEREQEGVKQDLRTKLLRERARANELRQREIALVKETVDLRSRLKEEQVVILINELRRRLHGINEQLTEEGHRVRLFVQVDKLSTEIVEDTDHVLTSMESSRPVARTLIRIKDSQEIRYPIYKDAVTVGRTGDNDIQVNDRHVSAYHALLFDKDDETYIEDLQSKNGVYVNGVRVTNEKLKDGDEITIGDADFLYRTNKINGSAVKALT